jgi:hypothetical protein
MGNQVTSQSVLGGKSRLSVAMAIVFLVTGAVFVFSSRLQNEPDSIRTVRIIVTILWGAVLAGLELWAHGGDKTIVDYWTIGHAMTGVVLGVWGPPGLLVLILTVGWEIIEKAGFSPDEAIPNLLMDIAVALAGWFVVSLIIAATTSLEMPPILW